MPKLGSFLIALGAILIIGGVSMAIVVSDTMPLASAIAGLLAVVAGQYLQSG